MSKSEGNKKIILTDYQEIDLLIKQMVDYQKIDGLHYRNLYWEFVGKKKCRGDDKTVYESYLELHHIIPKCQGGSNSLDNLVLLTYNEHIIAHLLLYLCHRDHIGLCNAANLMLDGVRRGVNEIESLINLDKLKNLSAEIRSNKTSKGTPVACLIDGEIIKTYKNMNKVFDDGFKMKSVSKACSLPGSFHRGFNWEKIDNLDEKLLTDYYKKDSQPTEDYMKTLAFVREGICSKTNPKRRGGKVIITSPFTGENRILRIYDSKSKSSVDGLNRGSISKFDEDTEDLDIVIGSLRWRSLYKFFLNHPEEVIRFLKSEEVEEIPLIRAKANSFIVICHKEDEIYRVFQGIKELSEVISVGDVRESWKRGDPTYRGFSWTKLEDWELDKRLLVGAHTIKREIVLGKLTRTRHKVISIDPRTGQTSVYESIESTKFSGYCPTNVRDAVKAGGGTHKGLIWKYYEQKEN